MVTTNSKPKRNIILLIGAPPSGLVEFKRKFNKTYRLALVRSTKEPLTPKQEEHFRNKILDIDLCVNFDSSQSIMEALLPYEGELLAATCRAEAKIPQFQKLIPYIPYLKTPTVSSLEWCTNKIQMRKRLLSYDKKISPKFKVVSDAQKS